MATRTSNYTPDEDKHLCSVYLDITQDPIIGLNQSGKQFWGRVEENYNSTKPATLKYRNTRSLDMRMHTMLNHVSKLKGCIAQVETLNPSGASEKDIMNQAKELFMQDPSPKYAKGFRFDHVWSSLKNFVKFDAPHKRHTPNDFSSSQSDASVPNTPVSSSPGISSFNLNLSDDNNGGSSSYRPEGVKKSKLKRKKNEDISHVVHLYEEADKKIQALLDETKREQQQTIDEIARKREESRLRREDKILLLNLETVSDPVRREYFRVEQNKILQKRAQESGSNNPSNIFGQYFHDFGGSGSDLPEY